MSRYRKKSKGFSPDYIIIGVEGHTREKQYFDWFREKCRASRVSVEVLEPKDEFDEEGNRIDHPGYSAPHWSLKRLERFVTKSDLSPNDQIWLVFDAEHFENYKEAEDLFELLKSSELKSENRFLAISNHCFEIWLALHITELPADKEWQTRKELKDWLDKRTVGGFNSNYIHTNTVAVAIRRASELDVTPQSIVPSKPGTRVYLLAQELLSAIKKY